MNISQRATEGKLDARVRMATRRDHRNMVKLRAELLDRFHAAHRAGRRWCPALCNVPNIEDEDIMLKHLTGRDGRWAAALYCQGMLWAYVLCRTDKENSELRIEGQTPRVLPRSGFCETGAKLLKYVIQQAIESGLTKIKAVYHGFSDELALFRQLYQTHGFTGECKFEMLSCQLRIHPGSARLEFQSAEDIGLEAFYEAEAVCGYISTTERSKRDCEFSVKMWPDVRPATDWLVAYECAHLVGTVRVGVTREGIGVLDAIAVAPNRRGRGLGRALLARGLTALVGRTDVVWLDVHHDNPAAIRLYRRAGFETHHVNGDMNKDLTGES